MFGMFNPVSAVTSQMGGGDSDEGDKEKEEEAERERLEALREAEERRKEKHRDERHDLAADRAGLPRGVAHTPVRGHPQSRGDEALPRSSISVASRALVSDRSRTIARLRLLRRLLPSPRGGLGAEAAVAHGVIDPLAPAPLLTADSRGRALRRSVPRAAS